MRFGLSRLIVCDVMKRWHASQRLLRLHLGLVLRQRLIVRRVVMLTCLWGNHSVVQPTGLWCLASRSMSHLIACTVTCAVTDVRFRTLDVAGLLNRLVDRQHDDLQQARVPDAVMLPSVNTIS